MNNVSIDKAIEAAKTLKEYCDDTEYGMKCRDCDLYVLCMTNFAGWTKEKFTDIIEKRKDGKKND